MIASLKVCPFRLDLIVRGRDRASHVVDEADVDSLISLPNWVKSSPRRGSRRYTRMTYEVRYVALLDFFFFIVLGLIFWDYARSLPKKV